jgi:hypothetical protein
VDVTFRPVQGNAPVLLDVFSGHMLPRCPKQDGLVGMSTEKDPVRGHLKDLPCPLNGSHIDRFIKGTKELERKGMRKTEFAPHDDHGQALEKRKQGFGPRPKFGRPSQQQIFQGKVVVPLYRMDPMMADHPDKRLQEVQAQGVAYVTQMYQSLGPALHQDVDRGFQAFQVTVTVSQKTDLSGKRVGRVQGGGSFESHVYLL